LEIEAEANHKLYGIGPIKAEIYPEYLRPYLFKGGVRGTLRICPLGKRIRRPYYDEPEPIPLYCLERVINASYLDTEDPGWHPLPPPPK
jgi:hypothetical protein